MAEKNLFICIGRTTREPELGYTKDKTAYCRITVAVPRKIKTKSGDTKEDTYFLNATAWGPKAEFVNEYVAKGHLLYLQGSLSLNRWKDKEGIERRDTVMFIEDVQLLQHKFKGGEDNG